MSTERWITEVGQIKGRRVARRHPLVMPIDAATGRYHRLADRTLNDIIKDLRHEQRRRAGELFDGQEAIAHDHGLQREAATRPGYDPFASQVTTDEED